MKRPGKRELTRTGGEPLTYLLPSPDTGGAVTVEEALANRRSHRSFTGQALSSEELSQILWAAYGINSHRSVSFGTGGADRTAPSAGALYPLELCALVGRVEGIEAGVYRYIPSEHKIYRVIKNDMKAELSVAALGQEMMETAPVCLFYSAVYRRNTAKYGRRGSERYVCMDLGHSAQNVYLQTRALGLGTCAVGAFDDRMVRKVLQLTEEETPLYIMPIGHPRHRESRF